MRVFGAEDAQVMAQVKKLMRGVILEIRTQQPREAVAVLKEHVTSLSVGLFGDRVHVVSNRPERITAEIERWLAESSIAIQTVRPIEPTLEDVFVSVLAEKERNAAP